MEIKKAVIIPPEGTIGINEESYNGCVINIAAHPLYGPCYVLHWWGDHGNVQYERGPALGVPDRSIIDAHMQAFLDRRAVVLNQRAEEALQHLEMIERQSSAFETSVAAYEEALADKKAEIPEDRRAHAEQQLASQTKTLEKLREQLDDYTQLNEKLSAQAAAASNESVVFSETQETTKNV